MNPVTPYVSISGDTVITTDGISAITENKGSCVRAIISRAEEAGKKYDFTAGRKTRSIVIYHNGDVFLTPVSSDTLISRIYKVQKPVLERGKKDFGQKA